MYMKQENHGTMVTPVIEPPWKMWRLGRLPSMILLPNENSGISNKVPFNDGEGMIARSLLFIDVYLSRIAYQTKSALIYEEYLVTLLLCPVVVFLAPQKLASPMSRY